MLVYWKVRKLIRIRRLALVAFVVLAASASGFLIPASQSRNAAVPANAQVYKDLELFGEMLQHVREEYVEKPDDKKLISNAINGMLMKLDPHSSYMSPKEFQEEQVETHGEFGGLGIDVTMENGVLKVIAPIDNMPAERAGVIAGDAITELDGHAIKGLSMDQAVDRMRGPAGSPITLTIDRKGSGHPIAMKIVREIIRVNPVKYSVEGDVGWIRIKSFENEHTADYLQTGGGRYPEAGGALACGLRYRPAQQSRRAARSGHRRFRCFPRPRRHRHHQGPRARTMSSARRRSPAISRAASPSWC